MNQATVDDLKQFIAVTISQQTSDLREDMSGMHVDISGLREDITGIHKDLYGLREDITRIDEKISRLDIKIDKKIDDLSVAVAEAIDTNNNLYEARFGDHEQRITKLESQAA